MRIPAFPSHPHGHQILLWFYGGSYEFGSGSFPLYDGTFDVALVRQREGRGLGIAACARG